MARISHRPHSTRALDNLTSVKWQTVGRGVIFNSKCTYTISLPGSAQTCWELTVLFRPP